MNSAISISLSSSYWYQMEGKLVGGWRVFVFMTRDILFYTKVKEASVQSTVYHESFWVIILVQFLSQRTLTRIRRRERVMNALEKGWDKFLSNNTKLVSHWWQLVWARILLLMFFITTVHLVGSWDSWTTTSAISFQFHTTQYLQRASKF